MRAPADADAAAVGLTRQAALADLSRGGVMGAQRADTMARTIARYERLSGDLGELRAAGPFTRAYYAARLTDPEIAAAAWAAYRPALPLTFEGASFAGLGFLAGLAAAGVAARLLMAPFRRRKPRPALSAA